MPHFAGGEMCTSEPSSMGTLAQLDILKGATFSKILQVVCNNKSFEN